MKTNTINLAVTIALALTACENDSYDKGEGTFSLTQADFVEAHANEAKAIDQVVTDDGNTYNVVPQPNPSWVVTADSTYRAAIYYNKVDDNTIKPIAVSRVPVASIVPPEEIKEMKTDPVTFESCWTSKNGKYINIAISLKVGDGDNDEAQHSVGIVGDELRINADGTKTALLTLFHDQGGVPEYYSTKFYMSLPCANVNADSVYISINTYSGLTTRKLKLRN